MTPLEIIFSVVSGLLGVGCTLLWHMFRKVEEKADSNERALSQFRVEVAKEYATAEMANKIFNRFDELRDEILRLSDSMRDRLERKVDKP